MDGGNADFAGAKICLAWLPSFSATVPCADCSIVGRGAMGPAASSVPGLGALTIVVGPETGAAGWAELPDVPVAPTGALLVAGLGGLTLMQVLQPAFSRGLVNVTTLLAAPQPEVLQPTA